MSRDFNLSGLERYRALFPPSVAERGRQFWLNGEVLALCPEPATEFATLRATVGEARRWRCRLVQSRSGRHWGGDCACAAGTLCPHLYAAALAAEEMEAPGPSFRERWEQEISQGLGRKMTDADGRLLDRLEKLFEWFQEEGHIRSEFFAGWEFLPPEAVGKQWEPLYEAWWENSPPQDPWELWQYIAYDLMRYGRPVPEVLRPKTDVSAVRTRVEPKLDRRDLERWRTGLGQVRKTKAALPRRSEWAEKVTGLRLRLTGEGWKLEVQGRGRDYRPLSQTLLLQLRDAKLTDLQHLPAAQAALGGLILATRSYDYLGGKWGLPAGFVAEVFALPAVAAAVAGPDGGAWRVEGEALRWRGVEEQGRVRFELALGNDAAPARWVAGEPEPLYLLGGRVYRGPPALPEGTLPRTGLKDPEIVRELVRLGVELPPGSPEVRRVPLRVRVECWIEREALGPNAKLFCLRLTAAGSDPDCAQERRQEGWAWVRKPKDPGDGVVRVMDSEEAGEVAYLCAERSPWWNEGLGVWTGPVTKDFPEEMRAWRMRLPAGTEVVGSPEIAALLGAPPKARYVVKVARRESEIDWFDVEVDLAVADTTLTAAEIALLRTARGRWVELPVKGWRRLEVEDAGAAAAALARLGAGLGALESGVAGSFHALQLADPALEAWLPEAAWREVASRAGALRAVPPPAIPVGLTAELRPYQREGFHFLAFLAENEFGGVLADDMGLGKTVQTIAWLLWLKARGGKLRALVVCPKSVAVNWVREGAKFAPELRCGGPEDASEVRIVNYAQLRLRQNALAEEPWDAVVLDEGQNIKNPASATAKAARSLRAKHRVVLTGTPVENRLLDLWSLFAFAQPGLLGSQAGFLRDYPERAEASEARARLAARVRHFLLRRTKAQVAADLPARVEEDVVCELDGMQAELYRAELKRARAMVAGVDGKGFAAVRFNILQSLLRLRQICCDPRLLGAESEPGAKMEALFDVVEPLRQEGHKVLIFSQFVEMLRLIAAELDRRGMRHLVLTGQTEDRQGLVDRFQSERELGVFLISLKAGGSGLNLTAASYVVLFDPWWNPAVEAQAIDRTHRIGQTQQVIAYRLIAKGTVEEKIRALQREKGELAAAVVQEEELAKVMDLETLRAVLA